ncbi:MAG: hypothetical protein WAO19_09540 [Candidatus Kryptoniota bacterium]
MKRGSFDQFDIAKVDFSNHLYVLSVEFFCHSSTRGKILSSGTDHGIAKSIDDGTEDQKIRLKRY